MKIAFYAPLKSPDHAVPSGDRLMARGLMVALTASGHQVDLASGLRSFSRDPLSAAAAEIVRQAAAERDRIADQWDRQGAPDLWLTYHPYYKSPDLIGPVLARRCGLPYVTVESSFSPRIAASDWADSQRPVLDGLLLAAVNICFTARDREGILAAAPQAKTAMLAPFIDPSPFGAEPEPDRTRMITVAMMRPGDKMQSYGLLASALSLLAPELPWTLTIVGDGPLRADVRRLFARFGARIDWKGLCDRDAIARLLSQSGLFVWPGFGEAYGLSYLEAQAAGLPVVAQAIAGVPEVVQDGVTGHLTPPGDAQAFAAAIHRLLVDAEMARTMARAARNFAWTERSASHAARRLDAILTQVAGQSE